MSGTSDQCKPKCTCSNHNGSSSSIEIVGAYYIVEQSEKFQRFYYTEYHGNGNSKGFDAVKNIHGKDSVYKLKCIIHIQK